MFGFFPPEMGGRHMIRITFVHPQRRGFRHHFRVVLAGAPGAQSGEEASVFVAEEELYNYHRFQLAGLTQLGRLCRFALEEEARTPHELQMLWNRELASAVWSGVGDGLPNAAGDAETLQERSSRTEQLRLAGPPPDDEE
jgi:hypothetical protein